MTIQLLTLLQDNPKRGYFPNEGMSEKEIETLEKQFNDGKTFPKALREFLYLAGNYNNIGFEIDPDLETLQKKGKAEIDKNNHNLDRPIFTFDSHNDCESFLFIYLDENVDDPKTYVYNGNFEHWGKEIFQHNNFTFKGLVEESIDRLLKGYSI